MNLLQQAFDRVRPRTPARRRTARASTRRLQFESLEDRRVMATFPFTIINNSTVNAAGALAFPDSDVYLTLYSQDFATTVGPPGTQTTWYSYDASGTPTATPHNSSITGIALNTLTQTGTHTYVINLPDSLPTTAAYGTYGPNSMRAYVSMGAPLTLDTNGDGSVNGPATGNDFFDYFELSFSTPMNPTGNLNIDTTNVDQFGIPMSIVVDSSDPGNIAGGVGIAESRASVIKQFQDFLSGSADPYAVCIWPTSDPTYGPYRILNPSGVLSQAQSVSATVFAQTALNTAISSGQTTFNVGCGASFPATPFFIEVTQKLANGTTISEIMQVTNATPKSDGSSNWTVLRHQQSTTAQAFNGGALINMAPGDAAMSVTQTTLTVGNTSNFPTTFLFDVRIESEIMQVTGYSVTNADGTHTNYDGSTTWTVTRGAGGTTAVAHNEGVLLYYYAVNGYQLNDYFNTAIDALFTKFNNAATPASEREVAIGSTIYTGVVTTDASGAYVLRFTTPMDMTNYDLYYPFFEDNQYFWAGYTPAFTPTTAPTWMAGADVSSMSPSQMVFECNGVFADNTFRPTMNPTEQSTMATLENKVVSALNRGVALLPGYTVSGVGDWKDADYFYGSPLNTTGQPWNHYAQFLHQTTVSLGGLNYGFSFDDQTGQASDIGVASFNSVTVTLSPWATVSVNPPQPPTKISKLDFFASYIETHYSEFVGPIAPAPSFAALPLFAPAPRLPASNAGPTAAAPVELQPRAVDAAHVVLLSTESRNSLALAEAVAETRARATEPVAPAVVFSPAVSVQSFRASLLASRRRG